MAVPKTLRKVGDLYLDYAREILQRRFALDEPAAHLIAQVETFRLVALASYVDGALGTGELLAFDALMEVAGFPVGTADEKTRALFEHAAADLRVDDPTTAVSQSIVLLYADRTPSPDRLIASSARALFLAVLQLDGREPAELEATATVCALLDAVNAPDQRAADLAMLSSTADVYATVAANSTDKPELAAPIAAQLVATVSAADASAVPTIQ